jgi:NAD(P)-dependent dehydrogenase (short-subunit alcohol dehydrogenase family)
MKTAVITGGTRGIGAGLVRDFLKLGWNVSYTGTSDGSVGKSLSLLSVNHRSESFRAFKCDVSEEVEGPGSDGRTIPGLLPYGTSKRAVRYFTDGFAKEIKDGPVIIGTISPGMVLTDMLLEPLRKNPPNKKQMIRIYNILANDVDTVTPFLVRKMTENKKNGAKTAWLTSGKIMMRFLMSPFSKRDVVSKYL